MLNAAKVTFDKERKIARFIDKLQHESVAAIEWLVFGRSPYLEWYLQYQLRVAYDYSRNLIHSARRTVDNHLPKELQLDQPLPEPTTTDFLRAIDQLYQDNFNKYSTDNKPSDRQKKFYQKVSVVCQYRQQLATKYYQWLLEWNQSLIKGQKSTSRWKALKRFCRDVEEWLVTITGKKIPKHSYLSVLRRILVLALLPHYNDGRTVIELIESGIIKPEWLVVRPFRDKDVTKRKLIPLSLLMGSNYVVGRPGSATVMTELALKQGQFNITIWSPRHKKGALIATVHLHRKLQEFLTNGARIKLLIIRGTTLPSCKLKVDLVLEGHYWMFLSRKALHNSQPVINSLSKPVTGIGIDINRIGNHLLAFSEEVVLPKGLLTLSYRYLHLEEVLRQLHRCLSKREQSFTKHPSSFNNYRLLKIQQELQSVYTRRKRLLSEIHRQCSRLVSQVLLLTDSPLLCVEDLHLTVCGSRGPLAKAILSMPDGLDLYQRAILLVKWLTGREVTLRLVSPAYTSQGLHVGCPAPVAGRLTRVSGSYDYVRCPACGSLVNSHTNAARVILARGLSFPVDPP